MKDMETVNRSKTIIFFFNGIILIQWIDSVPLLAKTFKRVVESVRDTAAAKDGRLFQQEFEEYKARHHRHYKSVAEDVKRYGAWLINYSSQLLGDPTRTEKVNDEEYDRFPKEINERLYKRFESQHKQHH